MMDIDESRAQKTFLETKTRTELESDLERCLERKRSLEEEKNALHNLRIDLETVLKQREEELSTMRVQLESSKSAKEAAERELEALKGLRSGDQGTIEELNQRVNQGEQEKLDLQRELAQLREALEETERDKETYRAYSAEAEKLIEVKTGKLMADLREIEQINQRYRMEIQEKDEKISEYEEEIKRVREEKEALEQETAVRKGTQVVSTEFVDELGAKLDALQRLVREFGPQLEGTEFVPEIAEREEILEEKEVETLLAEPEQIGVEPEVGLEPEGIGGAEEFEGVMPEGLEEEPLEESLEEEPVVGIPEEPLEEPTERVEEQLWEEPKPAAMEPEEEPERQPEVQAAETEEEKEKFPWEEEEEELGWGF